MSLKKTVSYLLSQKASWLGLLLLIFGSCGGVETLVLVDYVGVPSNANGLLALKIVKQPDGQESKEFLSLNETEQLPEDLGKMAFRLGPEESASKGQLSVRIAVLKPGWKCLGGIGESTKVQLSGQSQVKVFVNITDIPSDGGC